MKYTKTALGLLNAQYRSVLKKCLMINAGLFFLAVPVGAAEGDATITVATVPEFKNALLDGNSVVLANDLTLPTEFKTIYLDLNTARTINGNGHTIYGGTNTVELLRNRANSIKVIENITFDGIKYTNYDEEPKDGSGGVISTHTDMEKIDANFYNNQAWNGAAIYNSGTIKSINGTFKNNKSWQEGEESSGAAIFNDGWTGGSAYIENITGLFEENTAYLHGTIWNGNGTINNITATFLKNHRSAIGSNCGTIIIRESNFLQNDSGGRAGEGQSGSAILFGGGKVEVYDSKFEKNNAWWKGGAIANAHYGKGTLIVTGSTFLNNSSGEEGGAIYVGFASDVNISGSSFEKNHANWWGGAIYNKDGTITVTDSTFTNNDTDRTGSAIYNKKFLVFSGRNTFTGNYEKSGSVKNKKSIYNAGTVTLNENATVVINDGIWGNDGSFVLNNGSSLELNALMSGNSITMNGGQIKLGEYVETEGGVASFGNFDNSVNVVSNSGIVNAIDGVIREHTLGTWENNDLAKLSVDMDLATNVSDTFNTEKVAGTLSLETVNLLNYPADRAEHKVKIFSGDVDNLTINNFLVLADSYQIEFSQSTEDKGAVVYKISDGKYTLKDAVDYAGGDRRYNMSENENVGKDLADMQGDNSTLDVVGNGYIVEGNGYQGIVIGEENTLNLDNVTFENFADEVALVNDGVVNLSGDVVMASGIIGSGTTNVNGNTVLNSTLADNTVNVNNSLMLGDNGDLQNVNLKSNRGGTLDIGNKKVAVDSADFAAGSTLALKVNTLEDHGKLTADTMNIAEGATLKATLAQGLLGEQKSGEVTLLASSNPFVNNFSDEFDNNMYHFTKKEGADGIYEVKQVKSASDVTDDNNGTDTNIGAADAWIDGGNFEDGSVEDEIADGLADLAQNDGEALNKALSALAPADAPLVQTVSVARDDILFRMVDNHLRSGDITYNDWNLSSGDYYGNDSSLWFKVYMGKGVLDDTKDVYGFDTDSAGLVAAAEKKFGDVKVGVGYQYDNTSVDGFNRDVDVNSHTAFVYGGYKPNAWFANLTASYTMAEYDEDKTVMGQKYNANYNADTIAAQALTGYEFKGQSAIFTPQIGARYHHIMRDDYTDDAGQKVSAEDLNVLTAVAEARVEGWLMTDNCMVIKPAASLGVTYDVVSDRDNAVVSLANGSSYVVNGKRLNRFGFEASAGVTAELNDNFEASLNYLGSLRRDYINHSGWAGLKYKF